MHEQVVYRLNPSILALYIDQCTFKALYSRVVKSEKARGPMFNLTSVYEEIICNVKHRQAITKMKMPPDISYRLNQ